MKILFIFKEPKGTHPAKLNIAENEDGSMTVSVRNRRAALSSDMTLPKADVAALRIALAGIKSKSVETKGDK